jgi:RNA polymerase sigma-70 factor, ECF subfamily
MATTKATERGSFAGTEIALPPLIMTSPPTKPADDGNDELAQLRTGGEEALVKLFRKHHDRLVKMVRARVDARLRRRLDYEDVLQDAYLILARRMTPFVADARVPVFVWMRAAVEQALIDAHRRHFGAQMRDARVEVGQHAGSGLLANSDVFIEQFAADLTTPSQALARDEQVAQLTEAFSKLSTLDQEILSLRHFEELTNGEVAAALELSTTAASNRYIRALTRLRQMLRKIAGNEAG